MIDAHIHLDQYSEELVERYIHSWIESGVQSVVAVSTSLKSSYKTLKLKQKYPTFIRAAIGHHPEGAPPLQGDLHELLHLIKKEKHLLSAIGEIGLPTYSKKELYELYHEEVFIETIEQFLQLAKTEELPVVLHAVHEESEKVLTLLKKNYIRKAHFHWLKSSQKTANEIICCGYYVSVTPEVCYRKRDQKLVQIIPLDQLLIETDGPWQFNERFMGRQTTPLFLEDIITCLSNILSTPREELGENILKNTEQLYVIK